MMKHSSKRRLWSKTASTPARTQEADSGQDSQDPSLSQAAKREKAETSGKPARVASAAKKAAREQPAHRHKPASTAEQAGHKQPAHEQPAPEQAAQGNHTTRHIPCACCGMCAGEAPMCPARQKWSMPGTACKGCPNPAEIINPKAKRHFCSSCRCKAPGCHRSRRRGWYCGLDAPKQPPPPPGAKTGWAAAS